MGVSCRGFFVAGWSLLICLVLHSSEGFSYDSSLKFCVEKSITQKKLEEMLKGRICIRFVGLLMFMEDDYEVNDAVKKLEKIIGCIQMMDTRITEADFPALEQIEYDVAYCPTSYSLLVTGNDNLTRLSFHRVFHLDQEKVFIRANKALRRSHIFPDGEDYHTGKLEECSKNEVLINPNCTSVVGLLNYTHSRNVVHRVQKIVGQLLLEKSELETLDVLVGKSIVGLVSPALIVRRNPNLVDVTALLRMQIDGPSPRLDLQMERKPCNYRNLGRRVSELAEPKQIAINNDCLTTCAGGFISKQYLLKLRLENCIYINGSVIFEKLNADNIDTWALKAIRRIENGIFMFRGNDGFQSLSFFESLTAISHPNSRVPVLQILSNKGLKTIGLKSLTEVKFSNDHEFGVLVSTYSDIDQQEQRKYANLTANKASFVTLDEAQYDSTEEQYDEEFEYCYPAEQTQEYFHEVFKDVRCGVVFSQLLITNTDKILPAVQRIEDITGCLDIINTQIVNADLSSLKRISHSLHCSHTMLLRVMGNDALEKLKFHPELEVDISSTFIGGNKKLARRNILPQIRYQYRNPEEWCSLNEARRNTNCRVVVGEINVMDVLPLGHVKEVEGQLNIVDTNLTSLKEIVRFTVHGHQYPAIMIKNNKNLVYVGDILRMKIGGVYPLLSISNNDKICGTAAERTAIKQMVFDENLSFQDSCLDTCEGGLVDNELLARFAQRRCGFVKGDLIINMTNDFSGLSILLRVEKIYGSLIIDGAKQLDSLWFLNSLTDVIDLDAKEPVIRLLRFQSLDDSMFYNLKKITVSDDLFVAVYVQTYQTVFNRMKKRLQSLTRNRALFTIYEDEVLIEPPESRPVATKQPVREASTEYVIVSILCATILAVIGYGSAFIVYLWELKQEEGNKKRTSAGNRSNSSDEIPE